jgi:DNA-binding NarL/FixJ family response regulator
VGVKANTRIAICDAAASYRRGLGAALGDEGFDVHDMDCLRPNTLIHDLAAVLLTIRSASDWQVVRDTLKLNRDLTVIGLLVDPTPDRHAEALRCGAHAAVAWDAPPERIVAVVRAALGGMTIFDTSTAQAMAATGPPLYDPDWITAEEIEWLKLLARGATVQQLAAKVGYSERALYRLLHGLYGRMRVSNRSEAILQASRWGLLEEGPGTPGRPEPPPRGRGERWNATA